MGVFQLCSPPLTRKVRTPKHSSFPYLFLLSYIRVSFFLSFLSPSDASKVGFNKTARGPYAEIDLWWEPYQCDKGPTTYRLKMSKNKLNTINVSTKLTKFKLKKNFNFPVLFWDDYYVLITAVCGGSSVKLQEFWIDTGSGGMRSWALLGCVPEAC